MSKVLTYVEIDVPAWTQSSPDSPATELTLRFAVDAIYLPLDIPAIPNIREVSLQPAIISLGVDLGQRATVTITFRDHRHVFDDEDFDSGTFWGKFRARYGLTLQDNPLRLIHGVLGQDLEDMETRHFSIDTIDGPTVDGEYKLIAKDVLRSITGGKAQVPLLSNGFLVADITSVAGSATLSPAGIGSEYGTSGVAAIGGKEIVTFTRVGDVLTLTGRGQFNTIAQAHSAGDRVQQCLQYGAQSASVIIADLLIFSGIDPDLISLTNWNAETSAYLGTSYTALIANPVSVDQLISELIEQAALAIWWDDINQQLRLQVLRQVPTTAYLYDQTNTLKSTLEVQEQPERRLSDVQVYFAKINPLINDDELDNYRSVARVVDEAAETEYGSARIKIIRSRWIPVGGRTTAETAANKHLGRFRDPPRLVRFDVMRDQATDPQLGTGYQLGGLPFQDITGAAENIPIQITQLDARPDYFSIEAEEMLWTPFGADIDPSTRAIIFDSNINNVNLRTIHDALYPTPQSGDTVNCTINTGVVIGSAVNPGNDSTVALSLQSQSGYAAFDVGTWPAGVTINIIVNGKIEGYGGGGGQGGYAESPVLALPGSPGTVGMTALYTRQAINLTSTNGQIWAGGGGGGGGGSGVSVSLAVAGSGGGGGAGMGGGSGGPAGVAVGPTGTQGEIGANGSEFNGGVGGGGTIGGGSAGGPGLAGAAGQNGAGAVGGAAGAAGRAIDGDSFVTDIGAPGDIRGGQVN